MNCENFVLWKIRFCVARSLAGTGGQAYGGHWLPHLSKEAFCHSIHSCCQRCSYFRVCCHPVLARWTPSSLFLRKKLGSELTLPEIDALLQTSPSRCGMFLVGLPRDPPGQRTPWRPTTTRPMHSYPVINCRGVNFRWVNCRPSTI